MAKQGEEVPESVEVELSKPITIDGKEVSSLRMRDPLVSDQYAASKAKGDEADKELMLIANLCGVTKDDLTRLTMRDYAKLQKALLGFIG